MIGAIIGDVIGSRFERTGKKTKDFELFTDESKFTDDTVLTVAVADCILNSKDFAETLRKYGKAYPLAGYGSSFKKWLAGITKGPYRSWGNGSAMRVSPVGFLCKDRKTVLDLAEKSAAVTHNHEDGIKGAQAIALSVFLARNGTSKEVIKSNIIEEFGYNLNRTLDEIRPTYEFDVSCQGSVPEAIIAFLESENFEDAIRNGISIGGDSDTIACMAGSIASAFYKEIPEQMIVETKKRLPEEFIEIIDLFEREYAT
ncbi:MAG: ADP-ribosylglycohydrolase family protein [Saprospiraceae bacterium]